MGHAMSAEELFQEVRALSSSERVRFFSLIGQQAFDSENLSYQDLFGHLQQEHFTAAESAEYLEISLPTFRRYVQSDKIAPVEVVGRSQLFSTRDLKALKRRL